jgi:hypothetical protein
MRSLYESFILNSEGSLIYICTTTHTRAPPSFSFLPLPSFLPLDILPSLILSFTYTHTLHCPPVALRPLVCPWVPCLCHHAPGSSQPTSAIVIKCSGSQGVWGGDTGCGKQEGGHVEVGSGHGQKLPLLPSGGCGPQMGQVGTMASVYLGAKAKAMEA